LPRGLALHLEQGFIKLPLILSELLFAHHSSISLGFLREEDRFLRSISRLLSHDRLPQGKSTSEYTEDNQEDLRAENSTLYRLVLLLIFALLYLFSVAGCILALRWPWKNRNPPFVVQWGIFTVLVVIGQWGVFCFLVELCGSA